MHIPSSLLHHLQDCVPGFGDEDQRNQMSLALMLWACAEGGRSHKVWPGMFTFTNREIRECWKDDARMRRVVGSRYFTVHQGSNLTEATNAYAPSIEMAQALVRCIRSQGTEEWIDDKAQSWVASGKAIASMAATGKDGSGNRQTKWKGAEPAKFIPINVAGLHAYRTALVNAWSKRTLVVAAAEWARRQVRCIDAALKIAQNARYPGCFPIKYREGSTGRITAQGHSLQSMPGMVRSAALAGSWDYDISTCQWTILSHMAIRLGVDCPLTNAYIADKRSLRSRVSDGAGISLDNAKQCLTALLFGAVVQTSAKAMRFHPGDLVDAVGVPAALRLSRQPDFMALYEEIRSVGLAIVKRRPRSNGRLLNDLRITCTEAGSELAHLLQGAEAAALRAVVMQQQDNILLCVHDGWVAKERLDPDALAVHIRAETGYHFGIEESRLDVPDRDRIKRKLDEFEALSEGELVFDCPFSVASGEPPPPGASGLDREVQPAVRTDGISHSEEALLWTAYPDPAKPVMDRLGYVTPRPPWNLPPGSTAAIVDRKREEAAATRARRRKADDAAPSR